MDASGKVRDTLGFREGERLAVVRPGIREHAVTVTLVAGRSTSLPPGVFGLAVRGADLAYVHTDRVAALARRNRTLPGTLLGNAIAHELGHLLLPAPGHSGTGIMTHSLNVLNPHVLRFAPDEATAIRERLTKRLRRKHPGARGRLE